MARCEQTQTDTHTHTRGQAAKDWYHLQAVGCQENGHSCTTGQCSALSAQAACVGACECPCICLTYRYWLQLFIQDIQLGVGHGGPDGAGSHPLKVTPVAVPAADPDGGFSRAIDVVDLCVRQHFTCSLSHTPAQDRHSCSLNSDWVCGTVRASVQCQLLMQMLARQESSNVLNLIAEPHTCKGQTPGLYFTYLCSLKAIGTKPSRSIDAMVCESLLLGVVQRQHLLCM